ncbi:MAG: adenosylcobinamide-phosphate synthase CbiB [Candidatus Omnitrophota bacterium]|nr:adenosylcobinamide-phosphate synthase CbiB [Candidatus Omnitrophota bacterium]
MTSFGVDLPTLALAYGADLLIGDPRWFPHPVRGMGLAIQWGEGVLRKAIPLERLAGAWLVLGIVGVSVGATWWLLRVASTTSAVLGVAISIVLLLSCLSTKDLAVESLQVLKALEADDLRLARRRVARIVGRDTHQLDVQEVVRATIETIAESTLDGILSPLCYFLVGGVPLAVAYKAVNTLDSMVGHRSARYIRFGWAAATLDTWANWIPARWSGVVFPVAAGLCGYRWRMSWRCAWRDGGGGPVPNAGIPEAAMAGALGVRLGGVNWYGGHAVVMPSMGESLRPLEPQRIREAIRLMYVCSVVAWCLAMGVLLLRDMTKSMVHRHAIAMDYRLSTMDSAR